MAAGLPEYVALHAGRALAAVARDDGDLPVEVVHDARTSLRRLRATLRTLPELVEDSEATEAALQHLALMLGAVRDADVLDELLAEALVGLEADGAAAGCTTDTGLDAARTLLHTTLADLRRRAVAACLREGTSPAWAEAVALLQGWVETPPASPVVDAGAVLADAERRVVDRLRAAHGEVTALHTARKAAKRWRYAAELLEGAPPAAAALETAQRLQELLGDVQDLEIALELLASLQGRTGEAEPALALLRDALRARQRDAIDAALFAEGLPPAAADGGRAGER